MTLLGSDPSFWLPKLYPPPADEKDGEDIDLDNIEGVELIFGDITPEQAEAMLQELREQRGGTLAWDELERYGADDGWQ